MADTFLCGHDKSVHGKTNSQGNLYCALCARERSRHGSADARDELSTLRAENLKLKRENTKLKADAAALERQRVRNRDRMRSKRNPTEEAI